MTEQADERPRRDRTGARGRSGDALAKFDDAFLAPADTPPAPAPAAELPFRERALGGAGNPLENIDHLFQQTSRRMWLGIAALVLVVAAAVGWTAIADRAVLVRGQALVVPPSGFFVVGEGIVGRVVEVDVAPGDVVAEGQPLATVEVSGVGPVPVASPIAGSVVSVDARRGELATGVGLARVVPPVEAPSAVGLFAAGDVGGLAAGQPVDVAVNGFPASRYGSIRGEVTSVGTVPISSTRLKQLTGDVDLATALAQRGPIYEVVVTFLPGSGPSGVAWSRGDGPNGPVPLGALAIASVTVERQPLIRKAFG